MNKEKLIDRSRELGLEITKLVNEYRTSSGENVNYNEEYFSEFFGGIIAFLCTGNGEIHIEYDSDPKYTIMDGTIKNTTGAEHFLPKKHIDSKMSTTETVEVIDGKHEKSYTQEMDPLTYIELLKRTELGGNPVIRQKGVLKSGI